MDISENTIRKMTCFTGQTQDLETALKIKQLVDEKRTAYVVLLDGARRGAIGRISFLGYTLKRQVEFFGKTNWSFEIEIDGRENLILGGGQFSWLQGYNGPTVWKFTKKAKPEAVKILDKAGTELTVGDTVVVSRDDDLVVGRLTRRSDKGTVWIRQIKMREGEKDRAEVQIINVRNDTILKLSNEMLDQVMMAKLAY